MAEHLDTGKKAEELAAAWLTEKGYEILHRNWKYGNLEIDIIAKKDDTLHIVEVKSRKSHIYGYPEESVTRNKFRKLQLAANAFLSKNPGWNWIQYDVVAITMFSKTNVEYTLFEDVFY